MNRIFVTFHTTFKKRYRKLRVGEQYRCDEWLLLFQVNRLRPLLGLHPLKGRYEGFWSINISGDLRAVFEYISPDSVRFVDIDTHSKLYG